MPKKVLVVGDVIIDEYIHSIPLGLSSETPTIVAKPYKKTLTYGGAYFVAQNLSTLGCNVSFLSIGSVENVSSLYKKNDNNINYKILTCDNWSFTKKSRYYVNDYKLLQLDELNKGKYTNVDFLKFYDAITYNFKELKNYDAIVICDNRHGIFVEYTINLLLKYSREHNIESYVDSQVSQKDSNHHLYKGANYIFMNEKELLSYMVVNNKFKLSTEEIAKDLDCNLILKLGSKGSEFYSKDCLTKEKASAHYVTKEEFVDSTGAGDAFLAAYIASDGSLEFANKWAALSIMFLGTTVPSIDQYKKLYQHEVSEYVR